MQQQTRQIAHLLCFLSTLGTMQAAAATMPESSPTTSREYPADGVSYAQFFIQQPPLLPMPQLVEWDEVAIKLDSVRIQLPCTSEPADARTQAQLDFYRSELTNFLQSHAVAIDSKGGYPIIFKLASPALPDEASEHWQKDESYHIKVEGAHTVVTASTPNGFFYALKTLEQLIIRRAGITSLAICEITDYPDLQVRGFMNDVGRNFLPIELIKQEIDAMATLKFNTYHMHMTEYHGWRLESKIYPELKDPKNFTRFEGQIYTQEEFKELLEYCRLRNIMIIPEFDIPGHSEAFRKALNIPNMRDPRATEALVALIKELGSLASVEDMPYIHIGTDEVRLPEEQVTADILTQYYDAVAATGRRPIYWSPGQAVSQYTGEGKAIEHLWLGCGAKHARPTQGATYLDSQDSYINHIDPFEAGPAYYFRRPCPYDYAEGLGFILCSWPDIKMSESRHHFTQTAIFPAMAFVSEAIWNSPHPKLTVDAREDELLPYFSNLPSQQNELLKGFAEYESRVLAIRDRFFTDKEFPYVKQSHVGWKLIGPFPHGGDLEKSFPVEEILTGAPVKASYEVDGKDYAWRERDATGHTLTFKQYCSYPSPYNDGQFGINANNSTYYALQYIYSPTEQVVPFWVGAQHWPTSDRSNGGPPNTPNEWHHSKPKFYVNGEAVAAPSWTGEPLAGAHHETVETPLSDENYYFRKPTDIKLKAGWNQILIKSPCNAAPRRWMFTFAPVLSTSDKLGIGIREFPGLKFATLPFTAVPTK